MIYIIRKMLDWLRIGLNSTEKITPLSLRIPLEAN